MPRELEIDRLLRKYVAEEGSDLHLNVDKSPCFRIDGLLRPIKEPTLTPEIVTHLIKGITPDQRMQHFMETGNVDFAFTFEGARFRVNIARAGGHPKVTIRRLPHKLLSIDEIGLPPAFVDSAHRPRGLILVTGKTGSGKTTTMASVVNQRTQEGNVHVITIEDPTEYLLPHNNGIVTPREVGIDVPSFSDGVIQSLRQNPDIIVVGEMRDLETIRAAITAAETGHLVFGTLHTQSAATTVSRIVDVFPGNEKDEISAKLSVTLVAILCQQLIRRREGKGRVPAFELLTMNPAVAHKIRSKEAHTIPSIMQTGAKEGMQLLDDHLARLVRVGTISAESAIDFSNNPIQLRERFRKQTGEDSQEQ